MEKTIEAELKQVFGGDLRVIAYHSGGKGISAGSIPSDEDGYVLYNLDTQEYHVHMNGQDPGF